MSTTPICWSSVARAVVLEVSLPVGPPPNGDPPDDGPWFPDPLSAGEPRPTTVVPPEVLTPMTTAAATPRAPSAPATAAPVRRCDGGPTGAGAGGSGCSTYGAMFSVTTPVDALRRSGCCETPAKSLGAPA